MRLIKRFLFELRHNGASQAARKAINYISRHKTKTVMQANLRQQIEVMAHPADIIRADFTKKPYRFPPPKTPRPKMDIAWVVSPFQKGSGGHNTIFRFLRYLRNRGHSITLYLYDGIYRQAPEEAQGILEQDFKTRHIKVVPLNQFSNSHDAVVATGWETAYPVFNLPSNLPKFYFVQDFEPAFYGVGSKSVLAENTYRFGFRGITAGRWLTEKLANEFSMKCDYFDFGSDFGQYKITSPPRKRDTVCFYARPVTERRAFELGAIALEIFHSQYENYKIEMFGWDINYKLPYPYINRGILTPNELNELYNRSAACLVLSLTNASLLPFELLAAGCVPVMNDGANNRLVLGDNDYIEYTATNPHSLAAGLSNAIKKQINPQHAAAASKSVQKKDWAVAGEKVEMIFQRELFK